MNAIKKWREIRGNGKKPLSLQALGEMLDPPASAGTISAYETGSRQMSMDRLYDIARALNITPGQVLDGPPQVPSESELAAMLAAAQSEIEIERLTVGDYPSAVASALRAQLLRYSNIAANDPAVAQELETGPVAASQSRGPTKKASRG